MGRRIATVVLLAGLALALHAGWTLVAGPFVHGIVLDPAQVLVSVTVFLVGTILATRGLLTIAAGWTI